MADEIPGWARATIDRMNRNPDRARALLSTAEWPQIGDEFEVEAAGSCSTCGHPTIDVIERGDADVPVALVTSGCLICDLFQVVDLEEIDLVEDDEIPGGDGTRDGDTEAR
ncbi:hypothetical protein BRD56_00290 [Thermoplasmatales archaeon SW_10_69_26]|jgi:hypothetical protein|nr:MAG: hypothetical protein BRD56_00290 [Thermoplasmatales archaeon SW_10_69_26]